MQNWQEIFYETTTSTNLDAKDLIKKNKTPYNTVIWASQQTKGKGRYDRKWHSPAGNLYCSFIIKNEHSSMMSFVSAVSVIDTLRNFHINANITCKWPNDILVEGKKMSGILLEVCQDALIIGIGINLKIHPSESLYPVTSLSELGIQISPKEFLDVLAKKLYNNTNTLNQSGFETIRQKWLKDAHNLGGKIKVNLAKETISGIFTGISETGALLIDTGTQIKKIMAGDVFYL